MDPTISGASVRTAREAAKLSQSAVAQALGMNRMYYSLFEAGRYLINQDEESALRAFLSSKGIELPNEELADLGALPAPTQETLSTESDDSEDEFFGDLRVIAGERALENVGELAESTGIDSKRTANAVSAASAALQELDYPELVALAGELDTEIEGLIEETDFAVLPIEQKRIWEERAAGMLICEALYGDAWITVGGDELLLVCEAIRKRMKASDWNVRECGFFESAEKYLPDLRCHLAPYIARIASLRSPPRLST